MVPLSILDLAPIRQGGTPADTFREMVTLAQAAEGWGYHRYWLVEHHNTASVAGSATAVLIGLVAGATKSIRVGAGGIMLPNHSPLQVAEQFGTLAALYPGRIDLGLGRGIHADPATLRALRRVPGDMERFPADVQEVLAYFQHDSAAAPGLARPVRAIPGEGADVPVWILGSSFGGARLAATLGLPFAYASHFAPDQLDVALATYRGRFAPSVHLAKPHVMLSLAVVVADTDDEARFLFSSALAAHDGPLPPPVANFEQRIDPARLALLKKAMRHSLVGSPAIVAAQLREFMSRYQPDEIIVTSQIFDPARRRRSFELLATAVAPQAGASA
jgi:luciferase family oxidoreductase group 1